MKAVCCNRLYPSISSPTKLIALRLTNKLVMAFCTLFLASLPINAVSDYGTEADDSFQINPGLNDAWYNPDTAGQGYFITVLPKAGIVFLSWFTYDTDQATAIGEAHLGEGNHRWITAQGPYSGNSASLTVYVTSGGQFDTGTPVENRPEGTITLSFDSCNNGLVEYDFPSVGKQGSVPIQRVVPDNAPSCQNQGTSAVPTAASTTQSTRQQDSKLTANGQIDPDLNDAWYNPDTAGQGYFITVLPEAGIVFLAWFTYDTDQSGDVGEAHLGEANHRWVTAQGPYSGNSASLTVYISSGGQFDTATAVENRSEGTITLSFDSCNSGLVEYDFPSVGKQGRVPIQRVVPDNVDRCEEQQPPPVVDAWKYWQHEDVKTLDDWGETPDEHTDLVALYEKEESGHIALRVDYMNLGSSSVAPTFLGLDFKSGGVSNVIQGNNNLNLDIAWDVLIVAEGENIIAFDSSFNELPGAISSPVIERYVDYLSFDLARSALIGWDGSEFSLQALTTTANRGSQRDITPVAGTNDVTGRGKFILTFMGSSLSDSSSAVSEYDGFALRAEERPGEHRGYRYLLDAAEKYELPVVITSAQIESLPGLDFLGLNDRFRRMHENGLLDLTSNTSYGQFMTWWPDDVNQKAIDLTLATKQKMEVPAGDVIYPYESLLRVRDIKTLKQSGFAAVWVLDQYPYWFGGIGEGWSREQAANWIKAGRKVHRINGMDIIFDSQHFGGGWVFDERWEEPDWETWTAAWVSRGTDQGLHNWTKRTLLDMALDEDQQQFTTFGNDLEFYEWLYQDVADWNFEWLASHPWIEVTTLSDIASRDWDVIDHGTLELGNDEQLIQHEIENDGHYNAYFPQHYYGGPSNGHSPVIPEGVEIESLYDFVPYLRDGEHIPSGRIFGDDKTPDSIIFETLANLRASPENGLRELAWIMFLHLIGENTYHEAEVLIPWAKFKANYTGHVNKIIAGAKWAEAAKNGELSSQTVVGSPDLDLDGEVEYTLSNDQVFVIFENDGGRVEYAFAWHLEVGPVQLVAPFYQAAVLGFGENFHLMGETSSAIATGGASSIFSDRDAQTGEAILAAMDVKTDADSLEFETPDGRLKKHFTLSGDTLKAAYMVSGIDELETNFCFVTNMLGRFERDWKNNFEPVQLSGETVGWKTSNGGYAVVNSQNIPLNYRSSFLDSPAGDEMFEREDPDSYPSGYWQLYPWGCLATNSYFDSNFEISVTLRADSTTTE